MKEAKIVEIPTSHQQMIEVDGKQYDVVSFLVEIYNNLIEMKSKIV